MTTPVDTDSRMETEAHDVRITDTNGFLGEQNGLEALQKLFPEEGVTRTRSGFEYRKGDFFIGVRAYQDARDEQWRLRVSLVNNDTTLTGGVVQEHIDGRDTITIVRPSMRGDTDSLSYFRFQRDQSGRIEIGNGHIFSTTGASDPQTRHLTSALEKANKLPNRLYPRRG